MSPGGTRTTLFLNYRREDTAPYAGRLYDRLTAHFGRSQVFMDIDQIQPGEDFVEAINQKVGACEVAIVAIGPDWLEAKDETGKRRLDDSEDFVRMEIVVALERKIRVIPVLVGGARMPRKQDLPEALASLSRRNAIELSESRFHTDVDRLIEAIETSAGTAPREAKANPVRNDTTAPGRGSNLVRKATALAVAVLLLGGTGFFFLSRRPHSIVPAPSSAPVPEASAPAVDSALVASSEPTGAPELNRFSPSLLTPEPGEAEFVGEVRKEALNGSADAQFGMGVIYEFGNGSVPKHRAKALDWYNEAAAQGHRLGQEGSEDVARSAPPTLDEESTRLDVRSAERQEALNRLLEKMDRRANGREKASD
ncbi:MAG: TIR domain-containing protein [Chthoniobacterales bacterium]